MVAFERSLVPNDPIGEKEGNKVMHKDQKAETVA